MNIVLTPSVMNKKVWPSHMLKLAGGMLPVLFASPCGNAGELNPVSAGKTMVHGDSLG